MCDDVLHEFLFLNIYNAITSVADTKSSRAITGLSNTRLRKCAILHDLILTTSSSTKRFEIGFFRECLRSVWSNEICADFSWQQQLPRL